MARIISGQEDRDPSFALMKGMEMGKAFRAARDQRASEEREQARLFLSIQNAVLEREKEQAKALADANARAQMGDVQAMQQQMLIAQAANKPPEDKMFEALVGIGNSITEPKARAAWQDLVDEYVPRLEKEKQGRAAREAIKGASVDGLIDEGQFLQRLESGEEPETLTSEIGKLRHEQTIQAMAQGKSAEALTQAEQLHAGAPNSPSKLLTEYRINEFRNSPSRQGKPDEAAKFLEEVRRELMLSKEEKDAIMDAQARKRSMAGPASGKFGMQEFPEGGFTGFTAEPPPDQERTPAMAGHIQSQRAEKEKRYPGSTRTPAATGPKLPTAQIKRAKSSADITKILQAAGIPLTQEIAAQVANIRGR